MSPDWKLYANGILGSIEKIDIRTRGLQFDEFAKDRLRADAVLRNLIVTGEAGSRTPARVQQRLPGEPWSRIREVASSILPGYHDVRLPLIWETVRQDLPPTVPPLRAALDSEDVP